MAPLAPAGPLAAGFERATADLTPMRVSEIKAPGPVLVVAEQQVAGCFLVETLIVVWRVSGQGAMSALVIQQRAAGLLTQQAPTLRASGQDAGKAAHQWAGWPSASDSVPKTVCVSLNLPLVSPEAVYCRSLHHAQPHCAKLAYPHAHLSLRSPLRLAQPRGQLKAA